MKRLYEWRDGNGKRVSDPLPTENACVFHAMSVRAGVVAHERPEENAPPRPIPAERALYVFVTDTGERVVTAASECGSKVRLDASMPWFGPEGLVVP